MSDMEAIMKFESLPNEVLIECFQYLNAIDIFYSFDYLNSRFYNLIRHISLYLNIEHITKSKLVQFCIDVLSNSEIKQQIISLKLPKDTIFDTVETLFSFVSLHEFSQLRALTFNYLNQNDASRLSFTLPLLTNLRYLCFEDTNYEINEIQVALLSSTIQTLSIVRLPKNLVITHLFTSLVTATIANCSLRTLCYFFEYTPRLRYLNINNFINYYNLNVNQLLLPNDHAVHLKRLIINNFHDKFDLLEMVLKRTPNLKYFMISGCVDLDILDAFRWEDLITTSLPHLKVFKFIFNIYLGEDHVNIDKFEQFNTDFWCHEHHWYTEYILTNDRALIYTRPYMSHAYDLRPDIKRYYNKLFNNIKTFVNVTDLTLFIGAITDTGEHFFSNVKSLKLENISILDDDCPIEIKHIQWLKTIVNLCNLAHLDVSMAYARNLPSVMLELFKEAQNLSSLYIDKETLFEMFENIVLREYLKKMIKKLEVNTDIMSVDILRLLDIVKLCDIFFNLEEFRCHVDGSDNLEEILNQLSKLTHMKVFSCTILSDSNQDYWSQDPASKLDGYPFTIKYEFENNG